MPRHHPLAAVLLACAVLPGCSTTTLQQKLSWIIKPHEVVRNAPGARIDYYELGRHYQATQKHGLAMAAFENLLKTDAQHLAGRSALAELYSREGRFADAERVLREAVEQGRASAFLRNNLGYIYFLQGKDEAAIRELRMALTLDPRHEWARNNLKLAETALERKLAEEKAVTLAQRAVTTAKAFEVWGEAQGREIQLDRTLDHATGAVAEPNKPMAPMAALGIADVAARVMGEPGAKRPEATQMVPAARPKQHPVLERAKLERNLDPRAPNLVATVNDNFRLEVSNGNGITGFARRVSLHLTRQGIPVHSLTNHVPYQQATTEIQYIAGFEKEAERIMTSLRGYAIVTRADSTRNHTELRVVLGKDLTARLAEIESEKRSMMAATTTGTGPL